MKIETILEVTVDSYAEAVDVRDAVAGDDAKTKYRTAIEIHNNMTSWVVRFREKDADLARDVIKQVFGV